MSRYAPKPTPKKPPVKEAPKPQSKAWAARDYVNSTTTIDEVNDIKNAFDVFDTDNSGLIDPHELVNAFVSLGFDMTNKMTLSNLKDLIEEYPEGLDFGVFLNLATGRLGESHTRAEINKVFNNFDNTRVVREGLLRVASQLRSSNRWLRSWEST